jgi:hypothetical protein
MNKSPIRFLSFLQRGALRRGVVFAGILVVALLAFEVFNYSTTDYALTDVLGSNLRFLGIRWATILSVAFCGIDFAGIARLFTPEVGRDEPAEVWYLFGAWLLAAAMNATLTWWGVATAVRTHPLASAIISQKTLLTAVPVFVALMVWILRVLLIGSFSMAGDRLFHSTGQRVGTGNQPRSAVHTLRPSIGQAPNLSRPGQPASQPFRPAPKPEPTYHPAGMSASPREDEYTRR